MKKLLLICLILLLCGCSNGTIIHEHCTRSGTISGDGSVELNYELYYKDDVLLKLESYETVYSEDSNLLDTYYDAYNKIHNNYKNLEYYNTKLDRSDSYVSSTMIIDYKNIDIDKLIQIEGEEDNIFENNIPKVSKWKEFAKKVGTKCSVQ